jgi:putative transposase
MRPRPWTILLAMMAGWLNRHQQDMIEYLKAENAILKEKIGKKRIILSDEQRIRLAILGKNIGRKALVRFAVCFHQTQCSSGTDF